MQLLRPPSSWAKAALLLFGAGLVTGLFAVSFEIAALQTPSAAMMAFGLFGIPLGILLDWRRAMRPPRRPASRKRNPKPRPARRSETGAAAASGTRIARGTSAGEVRWRRKK